MRIAVIGAGIVGVSTAEWLRRDGHEVTLIDRIEPGQPEQTSYGNAGILASSGIVQVAVPGLPAKAPKMLFDPLGPLHLRWSYLPRLMPWLVPFLRRANKAEVERTAQALANLLGDSVDQHKALARGTPAERYIADGIYAHLYRSRAEFEADAWYHQLRLAHGFRMEERDRARLLQDDPHLGPHYNLAACWLDHGWITDPGAYVAALAEHFRRNGGDLPAGRGGGPGTRRGRRDAHRRWRGAPLRPRRALRRRLVGARSPGGSATSRGSSPSAAITSCCAGPTAGRPSPTASPTASSS